MRDEYNDDYDESEEMDLTDNYSFDDDLYDDDTYDDDTYDDSRDEDW